MRYHKPFNLAQRQQAIATYRSFRATIRLIAFEFPPLNHEQRRLFAEIKEAVRDFGNTLAAKDAKVDVARLNASLGRADEVSLRYVVLRNAGGRRT